MMRTILAGIFLVAFASPLFAQDDAAAARAAAGCGPAQVNFEVKTDMKQHPAAQPETGKALVYVFEFDKREPNIAYFSSETTKIGLDGSWVGANHGQSYFFFPVDPGDHRLCANWQSRLKKYSRLGSAVSFKAEAGNVYYFRAMVDVRTKYEPTVKLELLDSAEGQFLISASSFSTFRAKN
jgi:hypothetical protein